MKKLMVVFLLAISNLINAQNVLGDWNGALEVQGMQLRLVFHIMEDGENLKATMDSPDQGANGIPVDKVMLDGKELTIEMPKMGIKYTSTVNEDGTEIDGTFNQGPMSLPLKMTRKKVAKKELVRPQEPKKFDYQQEEVKFENSKGGHHLAGTLTIPKSGDFETVVVLITGSGPQDRNEELLGHKPFLVLSDHFTKQGIAVLRYDDRGVAKSTGTFKGSTSRDFADDASAAVSFLKKRKDMAGKKIGLCGHSEGGMIAPIVASENSNVDFIVLLAGPGIKIPELMKLQTDKISEAEGVDENMRKLNAVIIENAFGFLHKNKGMEREDLRKGLTQILSDGFESLPKAETEGEDKNKFMEGELEMMLDDWFLYFMQFDPADYLSKVKCPVLAVNGELDLQVTSKENLEGIKSSLKKAGNKNVTIKEFKGLNHLFQETKTGAPSEYAKLEETFNEEAMKYVSDWILGR
ncbi:MAG: alpha/beta hydrolase family protein [Saprospiraceae bacterium]